MNDVKKYLMDILYTGHRHQEMSEWVRCKLCGEKYKKWSQEKARLEKLYPDKFTYKK